jgi:hypothetical protein
VRIREIYEIITAQYDNNYISQRIVYTWVEIFRGGRTNVVSMARSGQLLNVLVIYVVVKEKIYQHIRDNLRFNTDEIVHAMSMS